MSTAKISTSQLVILLFISRSFNVINFIPIFADGVELTSLLIGNLITFAIQILLMIPAIILFKENENTNIIVLAFNKNKALGFVLTIVYLGIVLVNMIGTVFGFSFFVTNAIYPDASALLIIITMCCACFLCVKNGIEGIARAGSIMFIIFIIGMIFIFSLSVNSINLLNIHPILQDPGKHIWRATTFLTSDSTELILLILLFPHVKTKIHKPALIFIASSTIFIEVIVFLLVGVLGNFAYDQMFPFFTLASLAETKIFQRLDSIHMILWIFISFIKITLFAIISTELTSFLLPKKAHKIIIPLLLVVTIVSAIFFSSHPEHLVNSRTSFPWIITACVTVIPLVFCFFKKKQTKKA